MKKIAILLLVMMLSLCFFLVACDSTDSNGNTEVGDSEESTTNTAYDKMVANIAADSTASENIAYTYISSYATTNSMGVVRAAHIVNLFKDGSAEIYMGFFNDGMGGSLQEYYTGTYTLVDDTLTLNYFSAGNNEDDRTLEVTIENSTFAGKIWIGASYSTYDMIYYSVEPMSVANADEIYIGSTEDTENSTYTATALAVYYGAEGSYVEDEGQFIASITADSFSGIVTGDYSKEWAGLDDDDMLKFTYADCEDMINYSNPYVLATSFTAENNTYSNTLVRVK